jgi:hypothetical protein
VTLGARADDSSGHFLRSAYSLVLNTVASGILGVAFWIFAARFFDADVVGRDSVLIVSMMTLSTICQCNMVNLFARFLPEQVHPARLIVIGYAVNCGLALLIGGAAVLVLPRVSDDLAGLGLDTAIGWAWIGSLMLWGIFCLHDAALTGLRHAPWVPAKNTVFGALKLVCLPVFATIGLGYGIFMAWVVPMALLLVPVTVVVFVRACRRHVPAEVVDDGGFRSPAVRRFIVLDYTASVFIQGLYTVLPLLVIAVLGSSENAYFWIPFTLITAVDMMSLSIAMSMTVEGAFVQSRLTTLARTAVRKFAVLVLGAAAVLIVAAPLILAPFGPDYVEHGTGVLRLLAIGVVGHGVIELYLGVARVRQQGRGLALLGIARCVLALVFCAVLGERFGIMGVAAGWSLMAVLVALAVLPSVLRTLGMTRGEAMTSIRGALARGRTGAGRVRNGSGRGERLAFLTSVLALVAVTGLLPPAPAFGLLLLFVLTAPGTVVVGMLGRLGTLPEPVAGLVAAIGLAWLVLLAQSMLWLGMWYTRGWTGLMALACAALLLTRALGWPLWPAGRRGVPATALARQPIVEPSRRDAEGRP